jgi:hypothetical protein
VNNSAIAISGSPYHMRLIDLNGSGGNQDRSLSSNAAVFPGSITIVKLVASAPFFSGQAFDFTTDPILGSGFSLTDANSSEFAGGSITFPDIVTFDSDLVFTEAAVTGWTLSDLTCSIAAGGGTAGTFATDLSLRRATVTLKEGNSATCTFSNLSLRPTAAAVSISGRVLTSAGTGISMARLTVTKVSDGSRTMALSNPFGYYTAGGLRAGEFYLITVESKSYTFADGTKAMTLYDDVSDVNFIANP